MKPEQLKNSILQCAMQGKLVEQIPEEGTAEELYQQIKEEKQKLIKEGKIKKEKPVAEITEDEIPFDIPESWKWCRLSEVIDVRDGTHDSPKYVPEGIPLVTSKNLSNGTIDYGNIKYITQADADRINERSAVDDGDILFAMIGSIGNPVLVKKDREFCIKNMALFKRYTDTDIDMNYMYWFFYFVQYSLKAEASGGVQSFISLTRFREYPFPLPPLTEQKRIVAKIEELLPYVDRYAEAYEKLEHFSAKFPEDMKKSILQYAIQGKLVDQRPEEGTAEELYQQIQDEKQKLIKEGKIKKEKPLAEITEDEIPFDIPESWKWVRVGDIFNVGTGMTPMKSESRFYKNGTIPWVNSALTSKRYVEQVDTLITQYALDNTSLKLYPAHTLIVAMYGQGKTRGQITELLIPATTNQACAALESYKYREATTKYVYYCFLFNYEKLRERAEGTSQPNLNVQKIKETIIPLPPFEEQHRIVAKIEELLPFCERLVK